MVDKARLDQMLSNLRVYVDVLRELAATPREILLYLQDFLADLDDFARAIAGHEWDMD